MRASHVPKRGSKPGTTGKSCRWRFADARTVRPVGWVELRPKEDHAADVSYMVEADLRGRGLAPRALDAFLRWALLEIELRRVNLACHVENVASRRVAEKCNFALLGQEGDEFTFSRTLVGESLLD